MRTIFVDYLNFSAFLKILSKFFHFDEVKIISNNDFFSKFWTFVLRLLGFKVYNERFFFGDIFNSQGESLFIVARRIASVKCLEYSRWLLNNSSFLINNKKNDNHKKILELHISKTVWSEMEYYFRRFIYIKNVYKGQLKHSILIQSPKLIKEEFLQKNFNEFDCFFCGNNFYLKLKKLITFYFLKVYSLKNLIIQNRVFHNKKSIFTIAVDTIDLNSNERHFPHWHKKIPDRDLFIFNFNNYYVKISKNELKKNNIRIISNQDILFSVRKNYTFNLITSKKIPSILKLEIEKFNSLVNGLYYLLKELKCEKFIFLDPQDPITDAVQIISEDIGIQTICLQFSNMGMRVPLMMSLADIFLSFANVYEKVFTWDNLRPKTFYSIGYSFINKKNKDLDKIKKRLNDGGVDTIISYFDENVENHKWGLVSESQELYNLELLAKTVLKFKKIAVILKPQFPFHTFKKYDSIIIKEAISSGRYMELNKTIDNESILRNKFTPSDAAQLSDYCIGNLIGATAGLESALSNKKVLLINPHGFKSEFDSIYKESKIIFPTLDFALEKIISKEKNLGDWSKIINHFSKDVNYSKKLINTLLLKRDSNELFK